MTIDEWRKVYRSELHLHARRALLEECPEPADSPAAVFRKKLLEDRYLTQNEADIDTFIRGWVSASMLGKDGKKDLKINRRTQKIVDGIVEDWQLEAAERLGEDGLAVLEDEFYNMILLYIALSKDDRKYARTLFGFAPLDERSIIRKLADDIDMICCKLPKKLGLEDRLAPLGAAAEQAFLDACGRPLHRE